MLLPEPASTSDPLQFEPHDRLDPHGVCIVIDRPQPVGEAFGIYLPGSCVRPSSITDIPAGIHPPIIDFDFFLVIAVEKQLLAVLIRAGHLRVPGRTGSREFGYK